MAEAHNVRKDEAFTAIVIGECGMGKSTLVYNLIGRPSQVQIDGTDPQGVTKTFSPFFANLRGTARKNDKIIDTPGIGDQTVRLVEWVTMAEKAFSQVNAIVCCVSETNPRITLGAELVTQMINKGFLGDVDAARNDPEKFELLCNAVVLVGTKGNLAGRKSRKAMAKETATQFAKRCNLPWVKYVAVDAGDWEEGTDNEDETPPLVLDPLQKHLADLKEMIDDLERKGKSQKDVMKYTQIQKEDMINMCCNAMGVEVNDEDRRKMAHDLDVWRNTLQGVTGVFSFDAKRREKAWEHFRKARDGLKANIEYTFEEMKKFIFG